MVTISGYYPKKSCGYSHRVIEMLHDGWSGISCSVDSDYTVVGQVDPIEQCLVKIVTAGIYLQ